MGIFNLSPATIAGLVIATILLMLMPFLLERRRKVVAAAIHFIGCITLSVVTITWITTAMWHPWLYPLAGIVWGIASGMMICRILEVME